MSTVIAKFGCDQTMLLRFFREHFVKRFQLIPFRRGGHVDLEHTRIRCQAEHLYPRIRWSRISLYPNRPLQMLARFFHCRHQVEVVCEHRYIGQKNVEAALTSLDAERRTN